MKGKPKPRRGRAASPKSKAAIARRLFTGRSKAERFDLWEFLQRIDTGDRSRISHASDGRP